MAGVKRILVMGSVVATTAFGLGLTAWAVGPAGPDDDAPGSGKVPSVANAPQAGAGENEADASGVEGVHGGSIERFHASEGCALVPVGGLPGNWTHGDYVTEVASLGDAALIVEAAHSDCGKPMHAAGHGLGPPAHALRKGEKNGLGVDGSAAS
jgi:hypothetical protein